MADFNTLAHSLLLPATQPFRLPQSLIYFVTSRCNADCDFCLYHIQLNNAATRHSELTAEEVNKIAALYGPLHYLGLSGGEPFIRKDIADLCQAFVKHCNVQVIDIPSNFFYGERMETFVHTFCSQNPDTTLDLQLSLDHLGEKHDQSRKVTGLFAKAMANFQRLSALKKQYQHLRLKVNVVFLPSNKNDLRQILAQLQILLPFDRIQLTYPHEQLNHSTPTEILNPEDLKLFFELAQTADQMQTQTPHPDLYALGLRALKKTYRQLLEQALIGTRNTGTYCEAGKHIAVMTEAGDVYPCEILWNEKIGNVREANYNIGKLLKAEDYKKFRAKYLGQTSNCNCTWSCAINSEVSVHYKYFPKMAVNALGLLLKTNTG